ncbi:MAG: nucleotidyltransferase, partial [Paenibacillus sp.]|nr:nucleotidyltransferase [Paenibacillus sp.]
VNADAIRPFVPAYTWGILQRELAAGRAPVNWESFFRTLLARLAVTGVSELAKLGEVKEGLEHRIKRSLAALHPDKGAPFEQLMQALKTRRYTRTKLQRMMTRILLDHRKEELSPELLRCGVPYLRVLGFSPNGQLLLKTMRKTASVPVVTKAASHKHPFLDLDIQAATVHASAYRSPTQTDLFRDYYEAPLRLDEREAEV